MPPDVPPTSSLPISPSRRIAVVGNIVADVITRHVDELPAPGRLKIVDDLVVRVGGCGFTTAGALARLGADVELYAPIGNDNFATILREGIREFGIGLGGLRELAGSSSATVVTVNRTSERSYLHHPGVASRFGRAHLTDLDFNGLDALHMAGALLLPQLDGEPMAEVLRVAQKAGVLTSLDTAWDDSGEWRRVIKCLAYLDVFAPSLDESRHISGLTAPEEIARWAHDQGVKVVALKDGNAGSYVSGQGIAEWLPALSIGAIDSTGAGDSYDAGLLVGLLAGLPLREAARLATAAGALSVTQLGGPHGVTCLEDAVRLARLDQTLSPSQRL
jgi:sugar/nucleoside kinase (ribokinase family)